jgi:hypothetical protein
MRRALAMPFAIGLGFALGFLPAFADEGMWTFDHFPSAAVAARYGVKIDAAWLDRVRLASIRLSNCTASYISPDGLILTNHHCAEACLSEHSTKEQSLIESGFLAGSRAEEKRCGAQIADTLVEMEDITAKVNAATRGQDERDANATRKKTLTELEAGCEAASRQNPDTGALKCQSVDLYDGGEYFLYKYKRYDDVRLVFAPEAGIAAFGGDPDNFQFPRYCLDMSILRAYENGKPAKTPHYLKIDFAGPNAGDLVFVSGNPGSTDRLLSVAELEFKRDVELPNWLLRYSELRGRLIEFGKSSPGAERISRDLLNSVENAIKVRRKQLDALLDDALIARKKKEEASLRASVARNPKLRASIGDPWATIDRAERAYRSFYLPYLFVENAGGFQSQLFRYARTLVRGAAEREKPDTERLREFTDAALPRLEQSLAAPLPVYPELERLMLDFSLERMREWLGPDDPLVRRLLVAESPDALAARVVDGTRLGDPAVRLALWKGGAAAVDASTDPMIALAKLVDQDARAFRKRYEDEVEAPIDSASEKIAQARFATLGTSVYPDATFTLRLNYGTVQGWIENGRPVDPFTTLGGAFARATGARPFLIPDSWIKAKDRLDLSTRFDFASNNDIVGGNSGSPVVNVRGQIVGLAFDGNIHSISGSYWFDPQINRMIAVDTTIIHEALTKVYGASGLLAEMAAAP